MKTITVLAYRRPEYTVDCLVALCQALDRAKEFCNIRFDKLVVSCDFTREASVSREISPILDSMSKFGLIECELIEHKLNLGVARHPFFVLDHVFGELNSHFNVALEDDAVVTADSLALADWYFKCHGGPLSDYALLGFCNHRDFGRTDRANAGGIPDDPGLVAECAHIPSPFGWATTPWQWKKFLKATWNSKTVHPSGWDFSLSFEMRMRKLKGLHPIVSRCRNVGRFGGTHGRPEDFDLEQRIRGYSDNFYGGPFRIAARIPDSELELLDDWMLPEVEARRMAVERVT